jgi:hypothetical protein
MWLHSQLPMLFNTPRRCTFVPLIPGDPALTFNVWISHEV